MILVEFVRRKNVKEKERDEEGATNAHFEEKEGKSVFLLLIRIILVLFFVSSCCRLFFGVALKKIASNKGILSVVQIYFCVNNESALVCDDYYGADSLLKRLAKCVE